MAKVKKYKINIDRNGVSITGDSIYLKKGLEFIIEKIEKKNDKFLKAWLHWRTR